MGTFGSQDVFLFLFWSVHLFVLYYGMVHGTDVLVAWTANTVIQIKKKVSDMTDQKFEIPSSSVTLLDNQRAQDTLNKTFKVQKITWLLVSVLMHNVYVDIAACL